MRHFRTTIASLNKINNLLVHSPCCDLLFIFVTNLAISTVKSHVSELTLEISLNVDKLMQEHSGFF